MAWHSQYMGGYLPHSARRVTMSTGPNGEKRPADPIANAVRIGQMATRQVEEMYVNAGQSAGRRKGGAARDKVLSAERRSEVAARAAAARWGTD